MRLLKHSSLALRKLVEENDGHYVNVNGLNMYYKDIGS